MSAEKMGLYSYKHTYKTELLIPSKSKLNSTQRHEFRQKTKQSELKLLECEWLMHWIKEYSPFLNAAAEGKLNDWLKETFPTEDNLFNFSQYFYQKDLSIIKRQFQKNPELLSNFANRARKLEPVALHWEAEESLRKIAKTYNPQFYKPYPEPDMELRKASSRVPKRKAQDIYDFDTLQTSRTTKKFKSIEAPG